MKALDLAVNPRVFGVVVGVAAFVSIRHWQGGDLVPSFLGALVTALVGAGLMALLQRKRG